MDEMTDHGLTMQQRVHGHRFGVVLESWMNRTPRHGEMRVPQLPIQPNGVRTLSTSGSAAAIDLLRHRIGELRRWVETVERLSLS